MFQNANQLLHNARKDKTSKLGPMKGAIVVSRSKELINQIYATTRLLDTVNTVKVNRLASALQMNSPVVEFITPEKTAQPREQEDPHAQSEKMFNISLTNIQNNASWDLSDIILSTPTTLSHTISKRAEYAPYNINPAVIVFDECETFYEEADDKRLKPLTNILKTFFTQDKEKASKEFIECNKRRQFIFTGSSMQPSLIDQFKRYFPDIVDMESDMYGKISPYVEHQNVYIENEVDDDIDTLITLLRDKVLKEL